MISKQMAEQNTDSFANNTEYYPSFYFYHMEEFFICLWLSALAMTVKYTTVFGKFQIFFFCYFKAVVLVLFLLFVALCVSRIAFWFLCPHHFQWGVGGAVGI